MIMPAVLKRVSLPEVGHVCEDELWRLAYISGRGIEDSETTFGSSEAEIQKILAMAEPTLMYTPERIEQTPLKTSVTTLTRQMRILSDEDSEETVQDKRKSEEAVRTFRLSSAPSRPAFLEEEAANAVNIGTATHRFLRLIDLDVFRQAGVNVELAVKGEADRMVALSIISQDEAKLVRLHNIAKFLESDLGIRMLRSNEVKREVSFSMRIDLHSPTMVQGIIDCAFMENGEWILIDYKTDRDTAPETFIPRHEGQMNWYCKAIERLTRINVKEMWLFALRAGKAFKVSRRDV